MDRPSRTHGRRDPLVPPANADAAHGTAPVATVGALLREASERLRASGSASARLDAELLLAHALGIDRSGVLAHPDVRVGPGQIREFHAALDRRTGGEPVAYIRGIKEFYGLVLSVDRRALIPRPETERLVELAAERVRAVLTGTPRPVGSPPFLAWDVGTGSGAIAVALAVMLRRRGYAPECRVLATDISSDAVSLALENAVAHGVADMIDVATGDLIDVSPPPGRADLLVANLPYIPSRMVPELPVAASFEPSIALDGGPDGLDTIRRLLARLPSALAARGQALLEIGADQADAVRSAVFAALPGWSVAIRADLSGLPRVAELEPPAPQDP